MRALIRLRGTPLESRTVVSIILIDLTMGLLDTQLTVERDRRPRSSTLGEL